MLIEIMLHRRNDELTDQIPDMVLWVSLVFEVFVSLFCHFSLNCLHIPHHLRPLQVSAFCSEETSSLFFISFVPKILYISVFEKREK